MPTAIKPFTPRQERVGMVFIRFMSRFQTWLYRMTGGRFMKFYGGAPTLLLTTIGRKSGQRRTTPLIFGLEGDKVILIASKGGMAEHPLWYGNLVANPDVEVQIGKDVRMMTAHTASPDERTHYWATMIKVYKTYDTYQARTEREIPVVVLSPRA